MSKEVDERIVKLEFDNKDFEKEAKKSSSTLEKLKKQMDFSSEAKSMDDAFDDERVNKFASGLDKVKNGFSSLEVAAVSAIATISNRVTNLGINMVKSLSIDNIMSGFSKYSDMSISVGTLASQGYELDVINEQLNKLSWFSDETSYNFESMINTLGKFTASGQSLEDSVESMMGIANWAAKSGQNAEVATRAMRELAQAVGRGKVMQQDWMSIQNAQMDNTEFRKIALETAVQQGMLNKSASGSYITRTGVKFTTDQFAETLKEGWFTSDVLVKSLNKYSAAVDDIYKEYEKTGDLTSDIIERMSGELDEFSLKAFKAAQEARTFSDALNSVKTAVSSVWTRTFEKIFGNYEEATKLWTNVANELIDLFAGPGYERLKVLSDWYTKGGRDDLFGRTEEVNGALWNIYDAILAIVNVIKDAWHDIFPFSQFDEEEKRIDDLGTKLKNFTAKLREFTAKMVMSEETADRLRRIFRGVFQVLKVVFDIAKAVWNIIKPVFPYIKMAFDSILELLAGIGDGLSGLSVEVKDTEKALSPMEGLFEGLKNLLSGIFGVFKSASPVIQKMLEMIGTVFAKLSEKLNGIFTKGDSLFNVGDLFSGALLAGSIATIHWLLSGFVSWTQSFKNVVNGIGDNLDAMALKKYAEALKTFAIALLLIVAALAVVASIDKNKLMMALVVIAAVWAGLIGTLKLLKDMTKDMSFFGSGKAKKLTSAILLLSLAIIGISLAIKLLSTIPTDRLLVTLLAVFAFLYGLIYLIKNLNNKDINVKPLSKLAGAVALLGLALIAMAIPIAIMSLIPADKLLKALLAIMILLLGLITLSVIMDKLNVSPFKKLGPLAGAVALLGIALTLMMIPILVISMLPFDKVVKAIATIGVILLGLAFFGEILSKAGSGLVIALLKFSLAMAVFGLAMIPLAAGILALGIALGVLNKIGFMNILMGLLMFIGIMAIFAVLSAVLTPVIPVMLAFAAAALMISTAVLALAVGMTMLLAIVALGTGAITALAAAFGLLLIKLSEAIIAAIPSIIAALSQLVAMAIVILLTAIDTFFKGLAEKAGSIADSILTIVIDVLDALRRHLPMIIEELYAIFITLFRGFFIKLQLFIPEFIQTMLDLFFTLIDSFGEALVNNAVRFRSTLLGLVKNVWKAIKAFFTGIVDDPDEQEEIKSIGEKIGDAIAIGILGPVGWAIVGIKNWIKGLQEDGEEVIDNTWSSLRSGENGAGIYGMGIASGYGSGKGIAFDVLRDSSLTEPSSQIPTEEINVENTIYVEGVTDPEKVAELVSEKVSESIQRDRVTKGTYGTGHAGGR